MKGNMVKELWVSGLGKKRQMLVKHGDGKDIDMSGMKHI